MSEQMFDELGTICYRNRNRKYFIEAEMLCDQCEFCQRFDADTITEEQYKIVPKGNGKTESEFIGFVNKVRCKYLGQCKSLFKEGYHVTDTPPLEVKIEEKPKSTRKPAAKKISTKASTIASTIKNTTKVKT